MVNVLDYVVGKLQFLASCAFFKASLHYTTSMLMFANLNAILHTSIENELSVLAGMVTSRQITISWVI